MDMKTTTVIRARATLSAILLLCGILPASTSLASPVTADAIYCPPGANGGCQIYNGQGQFNLPTYQTSGSEPIITQNNVVTMTGKSFDKSSNVPKQIRLVYDFASMGGATSAIVPLGAGLPSGAFISKAYLVVNTAPTTSTGATIAIGANSTNDILAATPIAGSGQKWADAMIQAIPAGTTATTVKLTGATGLTVQVGSGSLTAGNFTLFVDYLLP